LELTRLQKNTRREAGQQKSSCFQGTLFRKEGKGRETAQGIDEEERREGRGREG
jgi:hypothetical protein